MSYQSRETRNESDSEAIFELRDVSVTYDSERGTSRVLNDVSLDIRREEVLGVVGESGSGKSMFASALLDAVPEPGRLTGEIRYHTSGGEVVDILSLTRAELKRLRWEEIAMVFQAAQNAFNPTLTVRRHFKETLETHGRTFADERGRVEELLTDLYLDPDRVLGAYPHELSGGMKQRAWIALSLVLEPQVLVMDEPTAALDLLMQRSILTLLERVQRKYDLTVVFITHDLPLVAGLAERLAVMYAFEFVEVGRAEDVLASSAHPYTRALLKSVPKLDTAYEDITAVDGSSPDPVDVPSGCAFHPRCPLADDACRTTHPPMHDVAADHTSACFYWEDSRKEIPIDSRRGEGEGR